MKTATKLARRLIIMYAFALSCIAVAAVGAYLVLHWGLTQEADNVARVNLSGQQRMVTQRILALSNRSIHIEDAIERAEISSEILTYLERLEVTHEQLAHDYDPNGRPVALPPGHDLDRGGLGDLSSGR